MTRADVAQVEAIEQEIFSVPWSEKSFIDACNAMNFKIINLPCRTTAENMSKLFFYEISALLDEKVKSNNFLLCYITVYETPNNNAPYKED